MLATIGRNLDYSDLLPHANEIDVGEGLSIRVVNQETLIAVKEQLQTEKNRVVLPILRETLREMKKTNA